MTKPPEAGIATRVREGGRYVIDPETGEEKRIADDDAGEPTPEPKKKVK